MPAKKKAGGKKKKSAKKEIDATVIDGVPISEMSKEELEKHIQLLREELDREREERNYFQLERDKVNTFWEITKRQLEEKKAELRNKDREMEDAEEKHQLEIKVYKQKVKHLLYEHQNQLAELKADNVTALQMETDEFKQSEATLRKEERDLKISIKERELAFQDQVKELKRNHEEECTTLRNEFERQAREIEAKYERRMRQLRDDAELRRKTELHEVEERKNAQIQQLMRNHEKAFSDIKNYYNDITINNLALINNLKEQVEEMKRKEERLERQMAEVQAENKRLADPLQKAQEELAELHRQMANYEKDKQALANTKARLKEVMEQCRNLALENEVLLQRFNQLQKERDDLYNRFVRAVHEVQEKSGLKNLLLEKKLSTVTDALEKKEAQLNEVLAASNLDPTALTIVTRKLEDVLDSKNAAIKDLQYELARLCKAYNDLLSAFQSRLQQLGVTADDLGFRPLQTAVAPPLGKAPAGLVSAPN